MKNLKKLSVVLFATLLSFNFTSCIEDGVSDAVDQVYLAQAEFLRAQAALKEAEAQEALARAVYDEARAALKLAEAEVELAYARETDAYTAGVLLDNEAQAELNAFTAQQNLMTLAKWQAMLDVELQKQLTLLAQAQSAHDVAMVALGEAVAQAKDAVILEYYADYNVVVGELQNLYETKITDEHDLAIKELMLTSLVSGTTATAPYVDPVTMTYYQAILEEELAELEASLVAEQAKLADLEAITADDASDTQKAIQELDDQIAALQVTFDALVIEKAEKLNAEDQAKEAWEAASAHYGDLMAAETNYKLAMAAWKEHVDDSLAATKTIAAAVTNIAAIPAAEAALAAVDTATANAAIAAAITAEDLAGKAETAAEKAEVAALYRADLANFYANTWVDWEDFFQNVIYGNDMDSDSDTDFSIDPADYVGLDSEWVPGIVSLEMLYSTAVNAAANYDPTLTVVDAQADLDAADAAETAAQAAWAADPAGSVITDQADGPYISQVNDLDQLGLHDDDDVTDGDKTYMRVTEWAETAPNSGIWLPAAVAPDMYQIHTPGVTNLFTAIAALQLQDGDVVDAGGSFPTGEYDFTTYGDNSFVWWNQDGSYETLDGLTGSQFSADDAAIDDLLQTSGLNNDDVRVITFIEVEFDDDVISKFQTLWDARIVAQDAQYDLMVATEGLAAIDDDVADALALVTMAYSAYGLTFPEASGIATVSDWSALQTIIDGYYDDAETAAGIEDEMEAAHDVAIAMLGTPGNLVGLADEDKAWESDFGEWYELYTTAVSNTTATIPMDGDYTETAHYQQLKDEVAEDTFAFVRYPRWVEGENSADSDFLSAYEMLENAYYEIVWAMEDLEALGTVASNNAAITAAEKTIADVEELRASHEYAIAYLLEEMERLADIFDFDLTLWDFENDHGVGVLHDLPLYAAYLDAMTAYDFVLHQFSIIAGQKSDLQFLRGAYVFIQDTDTPESVADFMEDISEQIEASMEEIEDLEDSIEIQKSLVATGVIDMATAEAWIAEYERRLDLLNTKIEGFETAAASLLARINALLN